MKQNQKEREREKKKVEQEIKGRKESNTSFDAFIVFINPLQQACSMWKSWETLYFEFSNDLY